MSKNNYFVFLFLFLFLILSFYSVQCHDDSDDILIYEDTEDDDDVEQIFVRPQQVEQEQFESTSTEDKWNFQQYTWVGNNVTLFYIKICGFLFAFLIAVINGYIGKKKNKFLAINWFRSCQDIFVENFAKIGNNKSFLIEKSYDNFEFFATGRKNCNYYIVNLNLMLRQCIWRYYIFSYFTEHKDTMHIQINFSKLEKTVLCIYRKNKKSTVQSYFPNLTKYTKSVENKELTHIYDIRADSSEIVDLILGGKILQFLNTYYEYINFICITDIPLNEVNMEQSSNDTNTNSNYNNTNNNNDSDTKNDDNATNGYKVYSDENVKEETYFCYLDFVIPQNTEELKKLISFSIFMIDACQCIELSERVKDQVKKLRTLIENEDKKRKQEIKEMEEKQKAKKIQKEKEKIENMTAQQQRKYEERKQKKTLKKNTKIKIIKM